MMQFTDGVQGLTCRFEGRLDTVKCQEIEKELSEKIASAVSSVAFDLEKVDYVASAFLRLCIKAVKKIGRERFLLTGANADIKKVFAIAGFDQLFSIR